MSESEWLSSTDPKAMLEALGDLASERKLRLFACAYCRQIWHHLTDMRNQRAVEVAERFADGQVMQEELKAAFSAADDSWEAATGDAWEAVAEAEGGWEDSLAWDWDADWAAQTAWKAVRKAAKAVGKAAKAAREARKARDAAEAALEATKEATEDAWEAAEATGGAWEDVAEAAEAAREATEDAEAAWRAADAEDAWEAAAEVAEDVWEAAEDAWEAAAEVAEDVWETWKAWKAACEAWSAVSCAELPAYFTCLATSDDARAAAWEVAEVVELWSRASELVALLRDIFGNPWRKYFWTDDCAPSGNELQLLSRQGLTWHDEDIVKMAQTIYDERSFKDMPKLADALEKAGCTNKDMLAHCREPAVHMRGCWVVDLLLGKTRDSRTMQGAIAMGSVQTASALEPAPQIKPSSGFSPESV